MLQPTGPQLIELSTNGFELHGFINLFTSKIIQIDMEQDCFF